MAGKKLDHLLTYESLMKGESNYTVTIGGLRGGAVSGILNAPMPLAGGNDFESMRSALSNLPIAGKVFDAIDSVSRVARITGNDTEMSLQQTRKVWQESRAPQLSIEMTFWNIGDENPADRPITKVARIYSALFPSRRKGTFLVRSPLGYKFTNENGDAVGTLYLSIGQWFKAGGLVMLDANFTPSLEISSDGTPLYYTGTVTLEPHRMITYEEFLGWFKEVKPRPVHGSPATPKAYSVSDLINSGGNDLLGSLKKLD